MQDNDIKFFMRSQGVLENGRIWCCGKFHCLILWDDIMLLGELLAPPSSKLLWCPWARPIIQIAHHSTVYKLLGFVAKSKTQTVAGWQCKRNLSVPRTRITICNHCYISCRTFTLVNFSKSSLLLALSVVVALFYVRGISARPCYLKLTALTQCNSVGAKPSIHVIVWMH